MMLERNIYIIAAILGQREQEIPGRREINKAYREPATRAQLRKLYQSKFDDPKICST
jgi:hypothetical protein